VTILRCLHCDKVRYDGRPDQMFCDNVCRAAYYREHGASGSHAPRYRIHSMRCEHCGEWTDYNDYANRGGKRKKKYCSDKCRQAAYRAKRKEGAKGYTHKERESARENSRERAKTGSKTRGSSNSRWNSREWWVVIGVDRFSSYETARKAWRELCKKHHPDLGGNVEEMQAINAAWDKAKKQFGK